MRIYQCDRCEAPIKESKQICDASVTLKDNMCAAKVLSFDLCKPCTRYVFSFSSVILKELKEEGK